MTQPVIYCGGKHNVLLIARIVLAPSDLWVSGTAVVSHFFYVTLHCPFMLAFGFTPVLMTTLVA